MKPYPSYKDSGVEWIGKIPSDWKVTKHKYNLEILSGFPFNSKLFSNKKGFPLIRIRDITSGSLNTFYEGDYSDKYIVKKGDLLIGMDGDFNVRWWEGDLGLLNQRCCSIKESSTLNRKWLFYLLPNELKIINDLTYFTTVKHLSNNDIYDSKTILPIKETQTQIVSFLDNKTQKIDQLIDLTEKKIELLKEQRTSLINQSVTKGLNPNVEMKDSGVEWIGEIPHNWLVTTVKILIGMGEVEIQDGNHGELHPLSSDYVDNGIPFVLSNNIQDGQVDYVNCSKISKEQGDSLRIGFSVEGDVLLSHKGSIGKVSIVENPPTEYIMLTPQVTYYRTKMSLLLNTHLKYYFQSHLFQEMILLLSSGGSTRNYIGITNQRNLTVLIPPIDEQKNLVHYLDDQTKNINSTIKVEKNRIELLKEYRQSLISDVVTGKIDVRNCDE